MARKDEGLSGHFISLRPLSAAGEFGVGDRLYVQSLKVLTVSSLLLLEFRQSVRLQVRFHARDKTKGILKKEGEQMLRDLQADLYSGMLTPCTVDWAAVHQGAERLSASHTESMGHRLADILHVATALHVGANTFLTFDMNQRHLAEREGMHVPF